MPKTKAKKSYLKPLLLVFLFVIICLFVLILVKRNKSDSPAVTAPTATPSPLTEITWEQTINLLQECQIYSVYQKRSREIILTDKNNQTFKTTEPKLNDITYQTNHLRSDCNDVINIITE